MELLEEDRETFSAKRIAAVDDHVSVAVRMNVTLLVLPPRYLIIIVQAPFTRYNLLSHRLHNPGCQTRLTTGLTTGCIVYTNIQPVVSLFTRYSRLSNRLYNRFDNRLYRVNGV